MHRTRGHTGALVLLAVFALGNAGIVSFAAGVWRATESAAVAMPCHGVPSDVPTEEQRGDTSGCQWASPAACCDSPQAVDTRSGDAPSAPALAISLSERVHAPSRTAEQAPAFDPPLPVPRNASVLLI